MFKKVDAEGKPIIHGRIYAYDPHHSWLGLRIGRIIWHRTLLVYLFEDNNPTFKPLVVNFQQQQDDWTTLVARDFVRFNSKKPVREVSKQEEMLEKMVVETWRKGGEVNGLMTVLEQVQEGEVHVPPLERSY